MTRIWPKSIAGRTALALIGGMLLVLGLAATVWWMGLFAFSDDTRGPRLIERVVTVAKLIDYLPRKTVMALSARGPTMTFKFNGLNADHR